MSTRAQIDSHRENVFLAHGARQTALAAANTEALRKAAHVAYHKSVLASAQANGVSTGAFAALHNLGDPAGESAATTTNGTTS